MLVIIIIKPLGYNGKITLKIEFVFAVMILKTICVCGHDVKNGFVFAVIILKTSYDIKNEFVDCN